jgi:hypothetical protein
MTRLLLAGCLAVAAAACNMTPPTAPSSFGVPTDPVAISASTPLPAPLTQTVMGTWYLDGRNFMTVTQDGRSVTGMTVPMTIDEGRGFRADWRGVISGTVSGLSVTLQIAAASRVTGMGLTMTCTSTDTFAGTLSGSRLIGSYRAGTTFDCGGTLPPIAVAPLDGPVAFTRQ